MSAAVRYFRLTALVLALALGRLVPRLALSRAEHPSLARPPRLARRVAALIPFYAYPAARVFRADGAPAEIAAKRRTALLRLGRHFRERYPRTLALTDEAAPGISDLQFTAAYRVPFQFRDIVRASLLLGAFR